MLLTEQWQWQLIEFQKRADRSSAAGQPRTWDGRRKTRNREQATEGGERMAAVFLACARTTNTKQQPDEDNKVKASSRQTDRTSIAQGKKSTTATKSALVGRT